VCGNNRCFPLQPQKTNTLCRKNVEILLLNLAVRTVGYKNQLVNAVWGNNRYFSSHPQKTNTLCKKNVGFFTVKPGGAYSNRGALKG